VLLGFHRVASALVAELERVHPSLVAETLGDRHQRAVHDELRRRGVQVVYGDIGNAEVLRHAGVESAEVIVATVPDELLKGVTNLSLVRLVRSLAPEAKLFACATRASDASTLRAAGADHVFRPPSEVAQGLVPAIGAALDGTLESFVMGQSEEHGRLVPGAEVID
jgi:Trk K+ transport system NAD-binding subunit